MNQWIQAFLIFWLGTGLLVVLSQFADAIKSNKTEGNE